MHQQVIIHNHNRMKEYTFSYGKVYFAGYFLYHSKQYTGENLHEVMAENEHFFSEHLNEIIGEFAIVVEGQQELMAIVDRKRSIPLFYYKEGEKWIITDRILEQKNRTLVDLSVKEFILSGFTSRNKTLYKDVFQIEAGSYIKIKSDNTLSSTDYFRFYHQPKDQDLESLSAELKETILLVFADLAKRLKSKVSILPLSGGYDSRMIAILLKEFDVGPITSFTYGKQGNKESLVSKEIADRLGIPWNFVEYKKEDWHQIYQSDEWKNYLDFAVNGSTMAHLQDWPAVTKIIQQSDEPYVFIPGHSGDFLAGSHLSYEITVDTMNTKRDIVNYITQKHHKLWKLENGLDVYGQDVLAEIQASFQDLPFETNEEASALFEYWDWKERQAKFIINSVRVYEFYQKEWEIPLWDDRLMEFFKKVPVKYRYKKYLYDYTLHKMYPAYFPEPAKPDGQKTLKSKYGALYPLAKKVYNQKKLLQQYYTEPMEWYGIYPTYSKYLKELSFRDNHLKYKQPYNINSFLAKDYILHLRGESR